MLFHCERWSVNELIDNLGHIESMRQVYETLQLHVAQEKCAACAQFRSDFAENEYTWQKKSALGCIPILSPWSLATGGCLPRASRRTVLGPKTYQVQRVIVHLQFCLMRGFFFGGQEISRSVVSGPRIVVMTRLYSPRNWSRTASFIHRFPPLQNMIEIKNRCW